MPGDTGAPGENIQASGSISRVLAIPLVFVLVVALVALLLKSAKILQTLDPNLPLSVYVLTLAIVVGPFLFYGAFRVNDWIRG